MSYGSILSQNPPDLPLTGGTMTGPLILSGDPTENLEAATKQYVDEAKATTVKQVFNSYVASSRDCNFNEPIGTAKLLFFAIECNSSSSNYIGMYDYQDKQFYQQEFGGNSGSGHLLVMARIRTNVFVGTGANLRASYIYYPATLNTIFKCSVDYSTHIVVYAIF